MTRRGNRLSESGRDAGKVLSLTPSGGVVVRAPSAGFVAEGSIVRDRTGAFRGRVVRVFGPVAHPYLSVRPRRMPSAEAAAALIGETLVEERE